jgi:hypothetical protein
VKYLLSFYNLLDKLIAYVKDEGYRMPNFAQTINYMVKCVHLVHVALGLGSCFCHVFSKTCQYVCNDMNVDLDFQEVNLKAT